MTTTTELLNLLEDTAALLQKSQINLKKCPKARLTKGYMEARTKAIEDYWVTFKRAHHELVKITPKEQKALLPYFVNEEFYIYEDLYLVLMGELHDMLIAQPSSSSKQNINTESDKQNQLVRLPKIQLPSFSGNYEEWTTFEDMFISLVHNNTTNSDVQKLHYLKSSVTGEAETLLKHIQVTQKNYKQAWDTLKTRYGNKRLIINSVLKKLFNQKKINSRSPNQIKNLLDVTTDCLNNLNNLNISTDSWDPIIIFLVVQKLDPESHKDWEQVAYKEEFFTTPTWEECKKFLQSTYRTLELVTSGTPGSTRDRPVRERSFHVSTTASSGKTCVLCKSDHTLCHCKDFSKLQPIERVDYVKTNNLCFNCLTPGHSVARCRVPMSCRICKRRHHSLLHQTPQSDTSAQGSNIQPKSAHVSVEDEEELHVNTMIASHHVRHGFALLATATVVVRNEHNYAVVLRALVDPGSQASFISEKATQLLKLTRQSARGSIIGVGSTRTQVTQVVQLKIGSRWESGFEMNTQAYDMSKQLTTKIPAKAVTVSHWPHLEGLNLADTSFNTPGPIDLLLGVKEYCQIIQQEIIKGPPGTPCAQNTSLGWILFGEVDNKQQVDSFLVLHHQVDLDTMLKSLWEIDTDNRSALTAEERKCEEIYKATYTRAEDGRYIVKLPTKTEKLLSTEGKTRDIALRRLQQLERRLNKDPNLQKEYVHVMEEYIEMNHMEEVPVHELEKPSVYLPHHAVIKNEKETTKVRPVFNASQKGLNGVSLNDELLIGPQLHNDMRSLIMRWRMKKICFVADVQKMYRQVLVTNGDRDLQRVLWRSNMYNPVKDYRLTRVTFGTASAPYLAVRTLHQVADDEGQESPDAIALIKGDCYVDDVMSRRDTVQEAVATAKTVERILAKGGFILQKWCSNSAEFLKEFDPSLRSAHVNLSITIDGTIRALGLQWNMGRDVFQYQHHFPPVAKKITKRTILADVQRLFDPLGWLAPAILPAKLLIQRLWLHGVSWDEEVDSDIETKWIHLRDNLLHLEDIEINRWLHTDEASKDRITIHGFSDASTQAYAAVAYLRVQLPCGEIKTSIIAARTRVAPIKPISLPRLELCGAVLLSRLLKQIKEAMRIPESHFYSWTDSSIVLSWLHGDPARWHTFVRNRVVEVLDNIGNKWFHVQTHDNPADAATRGQSLLEIKQNQKWWQGPGWLKENKINYTTVTELNTNLERKEVIQTNLKVEEIREGSIAGKFEDFDTLTELLQAITYCRRFLKGRKLKDKDTIITTKELDDSLKACIRIIQMASFKDEIRYIEKTKSVKQESRLKSLQPYLDGENILRVGGRLRHANLDEDNKHPIILDNNNMLTTLIVDDAHRKTLHGGVQLMLGYLRSKFWILKAKILVRKKIHKCLICAKHNASTTTQLMGDLPKVRVTPARPFLHSGVDFAGPFHVLASKGRGGKTTKAYVALFVCMDTKALHLELVGDLTSESFIGAFNRFTARRGKCAHIWSDQGRTFVGANKQLAEAFKEANLEFKESIAQTLALDGTEWHFIPAYSPHIGGLWEAGVKSVKYHLKRILYTHLTFEEMCTLLCQIESCLNSRPINPIDDSDIDNSTPLTPGHFLIGEAPITVPHPDLSHIPVSNLSRWQHMQKLLGDFWRRWQTEYLSRLQQRPKWQKQMTELEVGRIVLIKADNLPPGKWALGRIIAKHPGGDGLTRVYSVKSGDSIVRRAVTKLCSLPIDIDD